MNTVTFTTKCIHMLKKTLAQDWPQINAYLCAYAHSF